MSADAPTALIADDEEAPREQLRAALGRVWPGLRVLRCCANGVDAWDAVLELDPEICFLDIRMPGMSGLEVAQRIDGQCAVVLVTAHHEHAVEAFEAGAIDYVLKPVDDARLARTVQRVQSRRAGQAPAPAALAATLAALLDAPGLKPLPRPALLQASAGRELRMVRVDDVVFFESDSRYTRVVYRSDGEDGEALLRMPLKELLPQLDPERFWQVHRSVIVRADRIASAVRTGEGQMHLKLRGRAETLPVSRHFQGLFKGQ